jgi:large subunit ribosomal protein L9
VDADKRIIEMPEEVKELGTYTATLKFHPEVEPEVKFEVVNEGGDEVEIVEG